MVEHLNMSDPDSGVDDVDKADSSGGPSPARNGDTESGSSVEDNQNDSKSLDADPTNGATSNLSLAKGEEEDEDEEEEEEDAEPTLKYARLTPALSSIYRNGDSTSSFTVSGDKMLVGTHNGNVHVLSIPTFQTVRVYHAHSSSVTSLAVSPYFATLNSLSAPSRKPPPASASAPASTPTKTWSAAPTTPPHNSSRRPPVPATPSNSIHIATASMDGHVCISSLIDPKDVILRNFARPVHAVALSPSFKNDRTYLSGGTAGNLVLTVGGKLGVTEEASTTTAAAAASGWLNTIGLGSGGGRDTILHGGEGTISSIKWSLSGKYVVWNNEYGTRIIRSHLHQLTSDAESTWKRLPLGHIPRPNRKIWTDEKAGSWKARAEWIDEDSLVSSGMPAAKSKDQNSVERLLVGWGDTVWMIHVQAEKFDAAKRVVLPAKAEIATQLRFPDSVVSCLTLYTPSVLVTLLYQELEDTPDPSTSSNEHTPRKGVSKRQNGLPPDLRLVDLNTKQELETESLVVSRFESLSASDYLLSCLFVPSSPEPTTNQRGALEAIGGGLKDVGVNATRLFSSNASIWSGSSSGENPSLTSPPSSVADNALLKAPGQAEPVPGLSKPGLKIFIQTPFDCLVAVKRDPLDRLAWLLDHEEHEQAWNLVNQHPEIVSDAQTESRPSTPGKPSLADFFNDENSSQNTYGGTRVHQLAVASEKQRIGNLWIQQLVNANEWSKAGLVASQVLGDSSKWSDWVTTFAKAGKLDDITPHVPSVPLKPPLPSSTYKMILEHYISEDRQQLQKLLGQWDLTLFDVPSVISTIKDHLDASTEQSAVEVGVTSQDQAILLDALAALYIADNNPSEAIRCYVRIRNSDAALDMIREFNMIIAVVDIIFIFILIQITPDQQRNAPLSELDALSSEPIRLLALAASQGTIDPSTVVTQLQQRAPLSKPYLFFYFRALWQGDTAADSQNEVSLSNKPIATRRSRFQSGTAAELVGRSLIGSYADLVVSLFAEYSAPLLHEFLTLNQDYNLSHASEECRKHQHIPELVYLLSVTGQTSEALHLIIDELDDVDMAIKFANDIDEKSLWEDLVEYSLDKPKFIRGLLEEAGTSVDPVALVKRIPRGKQIPGLKDSLGKVLKEREATWSITETASRVLSGEVGRVLDALRRHRERGLVFDAAQGPAPYAERKKLAEGNNLNQKSNQCASCQTPFEAASSAPYGGEGEEHIVGFSCGHLFHLTCILDRLINSSNRSAIDNLQRDLAADMIDNPGSHDLPGRVGTKMRHAQMIHRVVGQLACPLCSKTSNNVDENVND